MDPSAALERLGSTATRTDLLQLVSRRALRRAVSERTIVRAGRDRYALPAADQARRCALMLNGYLSHLSAAMHWGWEVRFPPHRPQIAVPRRRPRRPSATAEVRRIDLQAEDVDGLATNPLQTVLWCARDLPFADALAVADSALRHRDVAHVELVRAAAALTGEPGRRAQRVALHSTGRAANPFESSLRAIAIEEDFALVPQFEVRARDLVLHPDLVDPIAGGDPRGRVVGVPRPREEGVRGRLRALQRPGGGGLARAPLHLDPGHARARLRAVVPARALSGCLTEPDGGAVSARHAGVLGVSAPGCA